MRKMNDRIASCQCEKHFLCQCNIFEKKMKCYWLMVEFVCGVLLCWYDDCELLYNEDKF